MKTTVVVPDTSLATILFVKAKPIFLLFIISIIQSSHW